jgi:hypothetical protein
VLGSETESLKRAKDELEKLIAEAEETTGSKEGGKQPSDGKGGSSSGAMFFEAQADTSGGSAVTGDRYREWSDRLRNVEEVLDPADLKNAVARVLDEARDLRLETQRNNEAPAAANLQARIVSPLRELRDKVAEDWVRKLAKEGRSLSPVDRDPVPEKYKLLVRRYYEELGAGK